jgi:hypothetical protein
MGDSGADDSDDDEDRSRKPVPFWHDLATDRKHPQHATHGMLRNRLRDELVPVLYGSSVPLVAENAERRAFICCLLFRPFREIALVRDGHDTWEAAWDAHYKELQAKSAAEDPEASASRDPLDSHTASLSFINRWLECVTSMREGELESAAERRKRQAARGIIEPRRTSKYDGLSYSDEHFTAAEQHDASEHYAAGSKFRARPLASRLAIPDLFARTPQGHFAALVSNLWGPRMKRGPGNARSSSSSSSSAMSPDQRKAAETLKSWDRPGSFSDNAYTLLRNQNKYIQSVLADDPGEDFVDEEPDKDGWFGARQVLVEDAYSVPNNDIRFPTVAQQLRRYGLNHRQSIAFVIVAARFLYMLTDATEPTSIANRATAALQEMKLDAQQEQLFLYVAGAAGACSFYYLPTTILCLHNCVCVQAQASLSFWTPSVTS